MPLMNRREGGWGGGAHEGSHAPRSQDAVLTPLQRGRKCSRPSVSGGSGAPPAGEADPPLVGVMTLLPGLTGFSRASVTGGSAHAPSFTGGSGAPSAGQAESPVYRVITVLRLGDSPVKT
jgi:hypothetical protein